MCIRDSQIAASMAEQCDLVCAIATPAAMAAFNACEEKGIPVIYTAVSDPVAAMLAKEDGTSGGTITGTSDQLPVEAQLKLIRAMMPDATKIGILYTTSETNSESTLARDQGGVKIIGLMIANALVSLAGAVLCQQQRFFDISMGTGTMVIGLASVIIGTNLFKRASFIRSTTAVLIGSILYKACVSIALSLGLDSQDMKLVTAALFLLILVAGSVRRKKVRIHA